MEYNPFDLLTVDIDGSEINARPIEFNGDPYEGAFPSKIATVCPSCGSGLEYEISFSEPPDGIISLNCYECGVLPEFADPFVNPVDFGLFNIDPLIIDPSQVQLNNSGAVLDKINLDEGVAEEDTEKPEEDLDSDTPSQDVVTEKPQEKQEEEPEDTYENLVTSSVDGPMAALEAADDMGEEVEFDDSDMVE